MDPEKALGSGRAKFIIGGAAALLLAVGFVLAPPPLETPIAPAENRPAPLLEAQVQQREAARPFTGVQNAVARASGRIVGIAPPDPATPRAASDFTVPFADTSPSGYAVFVSQTHLLTHAAALDGRLAVQISSDNGMATQARVAAYEPSTGLVLLETEGAERTPARVATALPQAGTMAVAVGRSADRTVAVPVFMTDPAGDVYTFGTLGAAVLPGMPVYTLDGDLFAIAAPEGGIVRGFPAQQAFARLAAQAASVQPQPSSFGLTFGLPDPEAGDAQGVVITDVVAGGPADAAGIEPGDILLSIGDQAIDSLETARQLLTAAPAGQPTRLEFLRNRRRRVLEATPASAFEVAALAAR